ncbi:alkylmercury lyase [Halosimplex carlsbadense 2-9-1]|uniref:Alkylmercury lyase n=1 Tax=Halosimplex carlsbadense 2-9-1 TaxID=797114 RepID=M0CCY8_9EURY|nr:alkylmercury lyase [Halosimplex carlsbadense]ELZ21141.1 alkylmercury lyase [Halosimplex carlsbadense 2-9-1]
MAIDTNVDDPIELPADFADHLAAVGNLETTPGTLAAYWAQFADHLAASDQTIEAADMYTEEPTRHEVHVDGHVHYSPCVVDALTAAELEGHTPVTVRSVDPVTRTPVTFTVGDEAMDISPADAVISFGVAPSIPALESTDESIFSWMFQADASSVSAAFCQYINAFESRDTYDQWRADTTGKTVLVQPQTVRAFVQQYVDLD